MSDGESALVLVQPGDTIEVIAARAQRAGARSVELLVPADNTTMQLRRNVGALRQMLANAGVGLVVISSDERVIAAARATGTETISVVGASVAGPLIPRTQRPAADKPADVTPGDDELLELLDRVEAAGGAAPAEPAPPRLRPDGAARTSLQPPARHTASSSAGKETLPIGRPAAGTDQARQREAATSGRRGADAGQKRAPSAPRREAVAAAQPRPRRAALDAEDDDQPVRRRRGARDDDGAVRPARRVPLAAIVTLLAVAVLAAGGWAWLTFGRPVVTVYAPAARVRELAIADESIPYDPKPVGDAPVVQAVPVSADVEFSVSGQVAEQTISPAGRAKGTVTVINTIDQSLSLPVGTEFVGRNSQGAEVRFVVDVAATIPGATTSASLTGRSTTFGQVQIPVTARSPGAASNVAENTVKQIFIPGQQLIDCGTSNFICQNGPIAGGSDEPQWVVTDADVQRELGAALTGLYNAGIQQLRAQAVNGAVDTTTVTPSPEALGRPESYEPPLVTPPVGQAADPTSRAFTVTVRARFTALAVPPDQPMKDQIARVAALHFAQRTPALCGPAEVARPDISHWAWDGASLKISGVMTCAPSSQIAAETRLQVLEALRGRSREDADSALRSLQEQGLIGEYELPQASQMPPLDLLMDIRFVDTPRP